MGQVVSALDRLLSKRSFDRFPDDDDGDVLWTLERYGADLSREHDVVFHLWFAQQGGAYRFIDLMAIVLPDFETELQPEDGGWLVSCIGWLVPDYATVVRHRNAIEQVARAYGGREDGWGVQLYPA